jgi:hypothetical protein
MKCTNASGGAAKGLRPNTESQPTMSLRTLLAFCCLLLICSGCPEPPMASKTVSLALPASQANVTVSVDAPEVGEALALINNALVSKGFLQDTNPPEKAVQGFLASYSRPDGEGLIPLWDHPLVWFHDGRVDVVFAEGRHTSGYASSATRATVEFLRAELSNRYGRKRVTIKHGPA